MIIYKEEKNGPQSVYVKKILDEDGVVTSSRQVSIPLYKVEESDFTYFLLYDDNMTPISSAYQFLNFHLKDSPLTSRHQSASALRLLYCYLSLSGTSIDKIDELSFKELLYFLRGVDVSPDQKAMLTQRSNNTVNLYLSVYRSFFAFAEIDCPPLFRSHEVRRDALFGDTSAPRKSYANNLKTQRTDSVVPKYISPEVFRKIYKSIVDADDTQAKLIVHLMYGYGLRLGEVLGLTIEDIKEVRMSGNLVPVIILRNRLSDRPFQYAKGLPHVVDERQYAAKDYTAMAQRIIITYSLYEELVDYINAVHPKMMDQYPNNYEKGYADIVSQRNKPETNHYIFLSRYGRVLSDQTWNNNLKRYFELAGVPIDSEIRENNLSHRFRHGFAMFHAHFSPHPVDALVLQKLLRHQSITSTMVYYNPTPEDEFEIKTGFQKELYDMIPELKGGLYIEGSDSI